MNAPYFQSEFRGRLRDPPTSLSLIGHFRGLRKIRARGRAICLRMRKEFYPKFSVEDMINLPNYNIYLKLMIDGRVSKPFNAETLGFG
jgi:hypothetical protein